jgi:hypothetical protein
VYPKENLVSKSLPEIWQERRRSMQSMESLEAERRQAIVERDVAQLEALVLQEEINAMRLIGAAAYVGVAQLPEKVKAPRGRPRKDSNRVTPREMRALILKAPGRVESCLLLLWSFQTQAEQMSGETVHCNGRGFSKAHVATAATMIGWIQGHSNRALRDPVTNNVIAKLPFSLLRNQSTKLWAVEGKELVMHYARQLAEIANETGKLPWSGQNLPCW